MVINAILVYHFIDPVLRVEIFAGKKGAAKWVLIFFKLMMYLSDTHICDWRNFMIGMSAIVLFILVTKKEYL